MLFQSCFSSSLKLVTSKKITHFSSAKACNSNEAIVTTGACTSSTRRHNRRNFYWKWYRNFRFNFWNFINLRFCRLLKNWIVLRRQYNWLTFWSSLISPETLSIIFWHTCFLGIHTSIPKVANIFLCCPIICKSIPLLYLHSNGLEFFFQCFISFRCFYNRRCLLNNHHTISLLHLIHNFFCLKAKTPIKQFKHI